MNVARLLYPVKDPRPGMRVWKYGCVDVIELVKDVVTQNLGNKTKI